MKRPSGRQLARLGTLVAACSLFLTVPVQAEQKGEGAASRPLPKELAPYFSPPEAWAKKFGQYRSPLLFSNGEQASTRQQWNVRRREIRAEWDALLGKWPPLISDPKVEVLSSTQRNGYEELRIRFLWTTREKTTGYLLIPDSAKDGRKHASVISVYYEPETAIGRGNPLRDFAIQLTRRGLVTLSIGTTEATQAKTYAIYEPSLDKVDVQPLSMLGYAAANAWHVLAQRPEVDAERIGIVGHSFGGKWAMFASCLFDKFACAAWSDPGIVFDTRSSVNYWEPWYLGHHTRPWRKRGLVSKANPARGLYPRLIESGRDLHELHALMAPRPFLVSGGSEDGPHRWEALNRSIQVNRLLGETERVGMTNRPDHSPSKESNAVIYRFFEHFLSVR
jgi:hypothetical protein